MCTYESCMLKKKKHSTTELCMDMIKLFINKRNGYDKTIYK